MMKQLIQKTKTMFFDADEPSQPGVRRIASHLDVDLQDQPVIRPRMTAEQQRIQLLEFQNQQLRADVARWKKSSIGFAHEMRDLLTD